MKAIRGAITVDDNSIEEIRHGTIEMLNEIGKRNQLDPAHVIQAIFSATEDLDAAYPAKFAREIGWDNIPLFCVQEMAVVDSLPMCLRVMLLVNDDKPASHVYLKGAACLRPDLAEK